MRRVCLLRHGATAANEKRLYCGFSDVPLSGAGTVALEELRNTMTYPTVSDFRVYTSGLLRTEQTLSILFGNIPHETEAGLREMNFGAFELHSYDELKIDPAYLDWISGDNDKNRCPGGESGEEMTRRVLTAFDALLRQDGDLLLVIHGGPIAAIMAALFPEAGKNRYEWQPAGGEGYLLEFDGAHAVRYTAVPMK